MRKDRSFRTPNYGDQVLHGIVPLRWHLLYCERRCGVWIRVLAWLCASAYQISGDAPPYSIVQPQKRRAPDLEIVVGTEVTPWIDVDTDIFLQRFQVS